MQYQPRREDLYGPSEESYRYVTIRAAISAALLLVALVAVVYTPEGQITGAVALVGLIGGICQIGWFMEWTHRTIDRRHTRRYEA